MYDIMIVIFTKPISDSGIQKFADDLQESGQAHRVIEV